MSDSCGSRGLRRMTPLSGGLKPSAVAGGPSVTRLTQSSCTGMRPSGMPSAAVKKMQKTSPMFDEIMYLRARCTRLAHARGSRPFVWKRLPMVVGAAVSCPPQ
jgi:hypothetical protein